MTFRLHRQGCFRFAISALICISFPAGAVFAQEVGAAAPEATPATVRLLDRLPEPTANLRNGLVINSLNLTEYQELIVPELTNVLRSGEVHLEVFSRLPYELSVGEGYQAESLEPALTEAGAMKEPLGKVHGPLFTSTAGVAESDGSPSRLLWNAQSVWWSAPYHRTQIAVHFVRNDTGFRTFKGLYERVYPRSLATADSTDQLFRERLSFNAPGIIKDFSWLRFRFQSGERDVLFMYSPVTKQTRQLTSSNSSDSLLGSSISLDDTLLWSGKISEVQGQVDKTQTYLMPVVALNQGIVSYSSREACETYAVNEGTGLWNYATRTYPAGAAWLPTLAVYIPRVMHKLTLTPEDPYSAYGRQVLYLDSELGIPVYKIVYDPTGSIWKIIIGVYGFAPEQDRERSMTLLQEVVVDRQIDQVTLLEHSQSTTCASVDIEAVLKTFTPTALIPTPEAAQSEASVPAQVAAPAQVPVPAQDPATAAVEQGVPSAPVAPQPATPPAAEQEPVTAEDYLGF